jgi:diadenosine tetraphosphate (Ap4A) HIT family hydrolase
MTSVNSVRTPESSDFTFNPECRFCTLPEPWRIIYETSNFVAQMGLGPLAEGYVVLLTRAHFPCIGALSGELLEEFLRVLRLIQRSQHQVYRQSLFFEHGRSGACVPEGNGEDLCYHAHLHLLPSTVDLADLVAADFALEYVEEWNDIAGMYQMDTTPYILVQSHDRIGFFRSADRIPRRYLRTKLATALGEAALADWAAFPSYDVVRDGYSRLGPMLKLAEFQ